MHHQWQYCFSFYIFGALNLTYVYVIGLLCRSRLLEVLDDFDSDNRANGGENGASPFQSSTLKAEGRVCSTTH